MDSSGVAVSRTADGPRAEIAHVLFMDVVSYSLQTMDQQSEVIFRLQEIVRGLPDFQSAHKAHELVCLPTGDGMALAFFNDLIAPVRCARLVALALKGNSQIQLRMGIHTGPVYRVADINTSDNLTGAGINYAQRVMDCGDDGHVLISQAAADNLLQFRAWKNAIHDLGEVEVKHEIFIHIFNVFTEEFGNPAVPKKMKLSAVHPPLTPEPNVGRLVAKLCDRRAQEEDFREGLLDSLERFPGVPQMYFVPGEEGECHESLVERLIDRASGALNPDDDSAGGRAKKIAWQYDGDLARRRSRLLYSLFESFGPSTFKQPYHSKNISPGEFDALLAASLSAYIAIQHEVHTTRWDSDTVGLVVDYLKFWNALPQSPNRPLILIFVSIIFPRAGAAIGAFIANIRKKKILNALREVERSSPIPCRVLTELPSVTREDVLEWFSLNHIHASEEKRLRAVDRLFQDGMIRPKAMAEIEPFCAAEVEAVHGGKR